MKVTEEQKIKVRKLKAILTEAELSVSREFNSLSMKEQIKKALSSLSTSVLTEAESIAHGKWIEGEVLIGNYFGGIPKFDVILNGDMIEGKCDILAENNGNVAIWKYFPESMAHDERGKKSAIFETLSIGIAAENQLKKDCNKIVTAFGTRQRFIPIKPKLRTEYQEYITSFKNINDNGNQPKASNCIECSFALRCGKEENNTSFINNHTTDKLNQTIEPEIEDKIEVSDEPPSIEYIGKIIQNPRSPLKLSTNKKCVYGYINEECKLNITEEMILIAESTDNNDSKRIICKLKQITSFPKSAQIQTKGISEFVTKIELEPMREISNEYSGPLRNNDLNYYELRTPTTDELIRYYSLPQSGIPLGTLKSGENNSINNIPFYCDEKQIYQSVFVCGAKGTGKTTFIKWLIRALTSIKGGIPKELPAVVIFDVEREFTKIDSKDQLHETVQQLIEKLGVGVQREIDIIRISAEPESADATLTLGEITSDHFAYFVPNLTLNTTMGLERIYKDIIKKCQSDGTPITAGEILREIQTAAEMGRDIHHSQREAIIRATSSIVFDIFDQPKLKKLKAKELLVPGKITVIDANDLTDDQQRSVALYLLSMFHRYKIKTENSTKLILILDEAHRIFPKSGDLKKDYIQRLGKFVGDVVHRGRRRKYGILLATQYPRDISGEVVDLCDTTILFRIAGNTTWLREKLGSPDNVKKVIDLPTGEAFMVAKGFSTNEPLRVCIPNICL
jgi:DNA helicase HerA-like ATPase